MKTMIDANGWAIVKEQKKHAPDTIVASGKWNAPLDWVQFESMGSLKQQYCSKVSIYNAKLTDMTDETALVLKLFEEYHPDMKFAIAKLRARCIQTGSLVSMASLARLYAFKDAPEYESLIPYFGELFVPSNWHKLKKATRVKHINAARKAYEVLGSGKVPADVISSEAKCYIEGSYRSRKPLWNMYHLYRLLYTGKAYKLDTRFHGDLEVVDRAWFDAHPETWKGVQEEQAWQLYQDYLNGLYATCRDPQDPYFRRKKNWLSLHKQQVKQQIKQQKKQALCTLLGIKYKDNAEMRRALKSYQQYNGKVLVLNDGSTIAAYSNPNEWNKQAQVLHQCIVVCRYYRYQDSVLLFLRDATGYPVATAQVQVNTKKVIQCYQDERNPDYQARLGTAEQRKAFEDWANQYL